MAASVSSWLAAATPTPTLASVASKCATTLSVGAVLSFGPGHPLTTLTHAAILETPCAAGQTPTSSSLPSVLLANAEGIDALDTETSGGSPQFSDFRDAFYESTFPVCYVLAATTVTAYMLVIMLFVTPRSFLDGGVAYLGRSGFTGSSPNGISIGGRPWLQKVAAMTVAISLTIATADTFRVAEEQYAWGVQNADQLQSEVMDSTELKIMRLISDTFLWLAQAQTLIRLFPRQREKVIIKWTAFALITLQVIFSALNSFYYLTSGSNGNARPQSFVDAVPALSYLFHLSLGLLYAAWVIYYALMKKRYAFYHPLMKNMPLISALSILSILIPVVFFVLDISRPEFIGWGEYVRWVGAAAASVVVWEWVERIEALEREEKKDGILGREVFDGDEMVEASASDFPWLRRRRNRKSQAGGGAGSSGAAGNGAGAGDSGGGGGDGGQGTSTAARLMAWPGLTSIPSKYQGNFRQQQQQQQQQQSAARSADATQQARVSAVGTIQPPLWPARPPPAITPVSRADTASAASTDYAVRYKPASDTTNRTPDTHLRRTPPAAATIPASAPVRPSTSSSTSRSTRTTESDSDGVAVAAPVPRQAAVAKNIDPEAQQTDTTTQGRSRWRALTTAANPLFNRQGRDRPPAAVAPHTAAAAGEHRTRDQYAGSGGRWDLRARLEDFAATQAEKVREKMQPTPETDSLPVTVIPAPPRQGAALARLLEEEGIDDRRSPLERSTSGGSGFSSFPGIGAGALPHALDRTTIDVSRQAPRGMGASVDTASVNANPSRPPLWPGVRAQPSYERTATTTTTTTYEYEDASDVQTPTEHSRRETEGSRGPPGP
ncbi:hypothetical protein VD0004_g8699 [Verticillium dahliae]|uniref:PH-response regulator protein palH/rim-21 n=1 Tax=Verticillium dahliae TaxID=27337 RepID=A0A444RVT2_VERDA|nr:hypothetical protein VD0004_g8699 [Verticillium dahliae]PNH62920.1 hypothetical protein VD0001_g9308 [Verticillium dahliae]RXG45257.1 hypothetical protein VDGE_06671 [Verticillium dahliae]